MKTTGDKSVSFWQSMVLSYLKLVNCLWIFRIDWTVWCRGWPTWSTTWTLSLPLVVCSALLFRKKRTTRFVHCFVTAASVVFLTEYCFFLQKLVLINNVLFHLSCHCSCCEIGYGLLVFDSETFLLQIFQQDILNHREPIALLSKQLAGQKFAGRKQDMVLMRNLTANLAKRWEKVHSKSLERAHQIDIGLKEAKMFNDEWNVSGRHRLHSLCYRWFELKLYTWPAVPWKNIDLIFYCFNLLCMVKGNWALSTELLALGLVLVFSWSSLVGFDYWISL